jgi:hypothetical protein
MSCMILTKRLNIYMFVPNVIQRFMFKIMELSIFIEILYESLYRTG